MRKTYKVGAVDEPSHEGGRIYPRDIVQNAIDAAHESICDKKFFVSRRSADCSGFELIDIIGVVWKLVIKGNGVYADIEFLDTPANREFQKTIQALSWIEEEYLFTTVATGNVQESFSEDEPDTVTDDYTLIGVCAALQWIGRKPYSGTT